MMVSLKVNNMKTIVDFPSYSVTEAGEVIHSKTGRALQKYVDSTAYYKVGLNNDRGRSTFRIDRLVMDAFVGPSELHINHRNGDKTDNRLANLEYVKVEDIISQKVDDLFDEIAAQSGVSVSAIWKIFREGLQQ